MIYFLIFLLLLFFSYNFDYLKKTANKYTCYYFILIVFILVAGLRYRIGLDSIRYETAYQFAPSIFELKWSDLGGGDKHEPLYMILTSIAKAISSEFWVMQILQATLVNVIVFYFIRKNTTNIFFAVLLYYVFLYIVFMTEVMREACAVSMFLLSWQYLKSNRWVGYFIFCTMAFLFHSSAIILFAFPILKWLKVFDAMKIRGRAIFALAAVLIVGFVIQEVFFDYISILSFTERIEDKIHAYSTSRLAGSVFSIYGITSIIIRYVLFPFVAVILLKRNNGKQLDIEPMVYLCFIFALLTIPIALFYRFNNYFMIFAILAMAEIAFTKKVFISKQRFIFVRNYLSWIFIFMPLILLQLNGLYSKVSDTGCREYMRYYPYSSVLDKNIDEQRERVFRYYGI